MPCGAGVTHNGSGSFDDRTKRNPTLVRLRIDVPLEARAGGHCRPYVVRGSPVGVVACRSARRSAVRRASLRVHRVRRRRRSSRRRSPVTYPWSSSSCRLRATVLPASSPPSAAIRSAVVRLPPCAASATTMASLTRFMPIPTSPSSPAGSGASEYEGTRPLSQHALHLERDLQDSMLLNGLAVLWSILG